MKIQLIASDLDGTLLDNKKNILPLTKEMLYLAAEQGISLVPATGRAFHSIPETVLGLPGVEYVITSNGAAAYSVSSRKRIYQRLLAPHAVEAILNLSVPEGIVMETFLGGIPYSDEEYVKKPKAYGATDYGEKYVRSTRHPVCDIAAFAREHSRELDSISFVCGNSALLNNFREEIAAKTPDIFITSSLPHLLEIGHKDAGKGKTLKKILDILGISPENAMAFGDADNDIDMLSAVKYGIAMGNATETCKAAADYITVTNEEDGVGKAIQKFADFL